MKRLAQLVIKFRVIIVVLTLGITAFLGYQISNLKMDTDIINSLPDNDSVAKLYKQIGNEFGGSSIGMIVLKTNNIFKTSVLEDIKRITDSLSIMPGISTVTSLTNIIDIRGGEYGIDIGHLLDEYNLPKTRAELDNLAKRVMSKEMYKGNIVSPDSTSTIVVFKIQYGADKQSVAQRVREKVKAMHLPENISFAGMPLMMDDIGKLMHNDMSRLLPVTFMVIMLILFIGFGSLRGVIMPLLSSGIAIVWVLGLMHLLGFHLDLITNELPIVLLAVGSAYTIHVINRINEEKSKDRKQALIKALAYITVPVFLSGVTTFFGFASFIFGSYLIMVKNFGIFTSLGVLIALVLSLVFIPALISLFSLYRKNPSLKKQTHQKNLFRKWLLNPLASIVIKHPKTLLTATVALVIISSIGIFHIKTSVNMIEYFGKDNATRTAEKIMQKEFGGSMPVFLVFRGDMQSPRVLETMIAAENYMKKFPNINTTQSVADLIEEMDDVMGEGKKIPDSKVKIQQLWFLLEGQDIMSQLVNHDLNKGVIQSRFASTNSTDMEHFHDYMNQFIQKHSTDQCQIELTGMPSVYVKLNTSLIRSQFTSLGLAILLVILIVALILKSFKKGLFAAIPILATIIILFGFMGFAHIALNIATVLVASVALGMGIDYSIHIITHFHNDLKSEQDIGKAIRETIGISGKAIIINVASVAGGFLVLLFSQIMPIQNFGLLVALSMIGSGFAALTILPLILILDALKQEKRSAISKNI
ncbi:MAG: RND family transporter [Bacteroidales bacterium]|nr:RND family transporter [Bacteroidales bacterium]